MSAYNPPIRNLSIFDTLLFRDANSGGVDIDFLNRNYLKFPIAQGAETLQQTTINGDLTLNQTRIHLGTGSQTTTPPDRGVAIGYVAGGTNQDEDAVAIATNAGSLNQGVEAVAIGFASGETSQGAFATALGTNSGYSNQGTQAVAVGEYSGHISQGAYATAVGSSAGNDTQSAGGVAIGAGAGQITQGINATSVGYLTGQTSQGTNATALGHNAGNLNQGQGAVAIGHNAGEGLTTGQGAQAIAIGVNAGQTSQGSGSIAIGRNAATTAQAANCIQINATGTTIAQSTASTCVVAPIRTQTLVAGNNTLPLLYNTTTNEVQYDSSASFSFSGSMTGNSNMYNKLIIISGAAGVYSVPVAPTFPAWIRIRNTDGTAKSLTSLGGSVFLSNYISSAASYALAGFQTITIQSNGGNWEVINNGPIDAQTINFNYTTTPTYTTTQIGYTYSVAVSVAALPATSTFAGIISYAPATSFGNQTIGIGTWLVHFSVNQYWSNATSGMLLAGLGNATTKDLYGRFGTYMFQFTTSSVSGTSVISLTTSTNINLYLMNQTAGAVSGGSTNANSFFKITRIA